MAQELNYDTSREPSEAVKADISNFSQMTLALLKTRCNMDVITQLPSLFESNGYELVTLDKADGVDPPWLMTWHRMTMMSMQIVARGMERMGDQSGWDIWNRIERASTTDEGTYVYYLPGSTLGRKPLT